MIKIARTGRCTWKDEQHRQGSFRFIITGVIQIHPQICNGNDVFDVFQHCGEYGSTHVMNMRNNRVAQVGGFFFVMDTQACSACTMKSCWHVLVEPPVGQQMIVMPPQRLVFPADALLVEKMHFLFL